MNKPAEILKLEKFYNITLSEQNYELDKNNQILILNLANKKISNLEPLKDLKSLTTLDLTYNQINDMESLKDLLLQLTSLTNFAIFNNPFLENIDINLKLDSNSNNLIDLKNYFAKEMEDNKIEVILPAKIMLFGNHSSGKSSFLADFVKIPRESKSSTHILDIQHYKKSNEPDALPEAIFFDFGGQDYYHGVYKAFMTNDSTNLIFWQQNTDDNKITIDKSNRNNSTQNFSRKYWIKQLKHYEKTKDENIIWLIQTHLDEAGHTKSWLNNETMSSSIANEFHIAFKSDKFKSSLSYLKKSLEEEIKDKQIKVKQPRWYKEFLQYILNSTTNNFTTLEEIKKNYHREDKRDDFFKNDLEQLSRQGLILYYPKIKELENVAWLNPSETIKQIHSDVLSEENISKYKGIVPKNDFEKLCDEKLRLMLLENRVIFLDETDEKYIIPSYLSRVDEEGNDFFFFSDFTKANFTLKFNNFIPFGFINQLICTYGKTKEVKKYWRDMLMFTLDDRKIKIFIKLDFEELKIEIFVNANKDIRKQRISEIEKSIFEDILAFYYDVSTYQSPLLDMEDNKQKIEYKEQKEYQRGFPDDMYLSVDSNYFVKYATLEDVNTANTILAYKNMDKQNPLTISTRKFKNFTNNRNIEII
jgi:internalin A